MVRRTRSTIPLGSSSTPRPSRYPAALWRSVGIHDGRHGAATYTKAAGGDLHDIKELLDHSTITITAGTCTSLLADIERDTIKIIPDKRRPAA